MLYTKCFYFQVLEKRAKRASKKNKEQQLSKRRKELMEARDFEMQTTVSTNYCSWDVLQKFVYTTGKSNTEKLYLLYTLFYEDGILKFFFWLCSFFGENTLNSHDKYNNYIHTVYHCHIKNIYNYCYYHTWTNTNNHVSI